MGIRVTEISTPFGGVAWEYTDKPEAPVLPSLQPGRKIEVFISSICGDKGKYDHVRAELKKAIEDTGLANVYLFEGEGAASMPAGSHYVFALEDSDICIFLIDNADGVTPGVQKEIDTVKKNNIKALYYFCDETQKEQTALQQSLMGAQFAKSKTISKFDELIQNGCRDLIDDITATYHHYCKGRLLWKQETPINEVQHIDVAATEPLQLKTMPKAVLKNIDRTSAYLLKFALGYTFGRFPDEDEKSGDIDDWCSQFLPILFECKSIKQFNVTMYLEDLKKSQTEEHFSIVQIRWQAIQAYFMGDLQKCVDHLENALMLAKETKQPVWVIKDILVDLRNQQITLNNTKNIFHPQPKAQQELADSEEELYYPLIDRIHESLYGKIVEELYKNKIESPYTVTLGGSYEQYGNLLASSFVIAMYNGSLTHILLIYEKIKDFIFYLSCKFSDWHLRKRLLQLAIFDGKEKEFDKLRDSFPELLNQMSATDAAEIMDFCSNHPLPHRRFVSQLRGFGALSYYLNDKDFKRYEELIIGEIKAFVENKSHALSIGYTIFKGLEGAAYRMSQDTLAELCGMFMERHYRRWYMDLFSFVAKRINLKKMRKEFAEALIRRIISCIDDEDDRKAMNDRLSFLFILRKQDRLLTEELDRKVAECFPEFYGKTYKLETTEAEQEDLPGFVRQYVDQINSNNVHQGAGGVYYGYATRNAATIRSIFLWHENSWDATLIDSVVAAAADTITKSKEGIQIKLDSVALLICVAIKFPDHFERNRSVYDLIYKKRTEIESADSSIIESNIDGISLKIGLQLLFTAMGIDTYSDMLELIPLIQGDTATTISVAQMIDKYLEVTANVTFPQRIEGIVLQNVLQWLNSENLDIRCIAARILLTLARNPENEIIVNRRLLSLIDTECVYIKNMLLRRIEKAKGISEKTREYIYSKCDVDPCYVVRMVCAEVKGEPPEEA